MPPRVRSAAHPPGRAAGGATLPLRTRRGVLDVGVVACDLDRTLTGPRLRPSPAGLGALRLLRQRGLAVVLATGRTADDLSPRLLGGFDAVVLEGGAVVGRAGALRTRRGAAGWRAGMAAWLASRRIPHRAGTASFSVPRAAAAPLRAMRDAGRCELMPNRDRVDVTMAGTDKGSGLRSVLRGDLRNRRGACVAIGDGANDIPLFAAARHGVAVGNAVPALKEVADERVALAGGRGVALFVRRRLLDGEGP